MLGESCPVCGYYLDFAPWNGESASDEICPCCGIQFGYDDSAGGDPEKRQLLWRTWRDNWIAGGMKWWSTRKSPQDWNPKKQLKGLH
jgi:hypothetical protein